MLIQGEIEMCIKRPAIAIRLQLRAAHLNGARLRGSIRAEPAEHAGYRNDGSYPPQNGRFAPLCWQGAPLLPVQAVRQGALRRPARRCATRKKRPKGRFSVSKSARRKIRRDSALPE